LFWLFPPLYLNSTATLLRAKRGTGEQPLAAVPLRRLRRNSVTWFNVQLFASKWGSQQKADRKMRSAFLISYIEKYRIE